jgi:hypothetical protein
MKKISRYVAITLTFGAAAFLAVSNVPASAAQNTTTTTVSVTDSGHAGSTSLKKVWEW